MRVRVFPPSSPLLAFHLVACLVGGWAALNLTLSLWVSVRSLPFLPSFLFCSFLGLLEDAPLLYLHPLSFLSLYFPDACEFVV